MADFYEGSITTYKYRGLDTIEKIQGDLFFKLSSDPKIYEKINEIIDKVNILMDLKNYEIYKKGI